MNCHFRLNNYIRGYSIWWKVHFFQTQVSSWHNNQTHFWRQQPGQWYETCPSPDIYHLWSTTFFGKGNSCDPTRTVNPHHLAESWSSPSSLIQLRSRALVMWRWVCCSVWRDVLSASSLKLHKKPELHSQSSNHIPALRTEIHSLWFGYLFLD